MLSVFRWILLKELFCLLLLASISFPTYAQRSQYNIPRNVWSVRAIDLDMDSHLELVAGHNYDWFTYWGGISIIKNLGYGNFQLLDSLFFHGGQVILSENLDDNPFPELLFGKWNTTQFIGLLYNNNYSDTCFLNISSDQPVGYFALGDVDLNGYIDILFASNNGQFWGVFYNYGNRVFSLPEFHEVVNAGPLDIVCSDLNGDGRGDVVVCGVDIEIYYSYYNGFQKETISDAHKSMLEVVDFNDDGYNDLVSATVIPAADVTSLVIYMNQADTNLEALPEFTFSPGSSDFCVNDFNNDKLPDVAFLSYFPYISGGGADTLGGINILYNIGNFQVSDPQFIQVTNRGEVWRHFTSADLDGNGYNDFAVVKTLEGHLEANLELLFNDGKGHFSGNPAGVESSDTNSVSQNITCYPNPFFNKTILSLKLQKAEFVKLSIYNLQGQLIRNIAEDHFFKGNHSFEWDGCNVNGVQCRPGIYILNLKVDGKQPQSIKLIKL